MIGIYKITSPTKRIYIGQSINIERRFNSYYRLIHCEKQIKLYRSFLKYGINKHKFEIICECEILELNDKERYYQDLYNVLKNGLNCSLTKSSDRNGKMSDESKIKMSNARIGIKLSDETKLKMSVSKRNMSNETKLKMSMAKRNMSDETKRKISEANRNMSDETRKKISLGNKGRFVSEETRQKFSKYNTGNKYNLGKKHSKETKRKISEANINNGILTLNIETGIYYATLKEAAESINIKQTKLRMHLKGYIKNTTSLIYV
jgi:group I intron endonuclease